MLVPVYDIQNCGPRHRFVANGKLVHNSDKVNLQNLPSRGPHAKVLKTCMTAPEGYTIIEADSAQIEARVLAWLAGQDDLVRDFQNGEDVYKKMAARIYGISVKEVDESQRFIGKQTILGCGYGMGAVRFREQLKSMGVELSEEECRRIIRIYRESNDKIIKLWKQAQAVLAGLVMGDAYELGAVPCLRVVPSELGIELPSGLHLRYKGLECFEGEKGLQYSYQTRMGPTNIYGGKVIENVCQAIARCIIAEQMLRISKRYRVALTVHDSVVSVVLDAEVDAAAKYIEECMAWIPKWAKGLPVSGEANTGPNYGEVKRWERK